MGQTVFPSLGVTKDIKMWKNGFGQTDLLAFCVEREKSQFPYKSDRPVRGKKRLWSFDRDGIQWVSNEMSSLPLSNPGLSGSKSAYELSIIIPWISNEMFILREIDRKCIYYS